MLLIGLIETAMFPLLNMQFKQKYTKLCIHICY